MSTAQQLAAKTLLADTKRDELASLFKTRNLALRNFDANPTRTTATAYQSAHNAYVAKQLELRDLYAEIQSLSKLISA